MLSIVQKSIIEGSKRFPEDVILESLVNALSNYVDDKSELNRQKLELKMIILLTRYTTEGKTVNEVIKEYEMNKAGLRLFQTDNN